MIFLLFRGEIREKNLFDVVFFNRFTGEELESNYYIVSQFLFNKYTLETAVFLVRSCSSALISISITHRDSRVYLSLPS
jgi:hypothetical protein